MRQLLALPVSLSLLLLTGCAIEDQRPASHERWYQIDDSHRCPPGHSRNGYCYPDRDFRRDDYRGNGYYDNRDHDNRYRNDDNRHDDNEWRDRDRDDYCRYHDCRKDRDDYCRHHDCRHDSRDNDRKHEQQDVMDSSLHGGYKRDMERMQNNSVVQQQLQERQQLQEQQQEMQRRREREEQARRMHEERAQRHENRDGDTRWHHDDDRNQARERPRGIRTVPKDSSPPNTPAPEDKTNASSEQNTDNHDGRRTRRKMRREEAGSLQSSP